MNKYYERKEKIIREAEERVDKKLMEWQEKTLAREEEFEKLIGDTCLYVNRYGRQVTRRSAQTWNMQQHLAVTNKKNLLELKRALSELGVKSADLPIHVNRKEEDGSDRILDQQPPLGIRMLTEEDDESSTASSDTEKQADNIPPPISAEEENDKMMKPPARVANMMGRRQRLDSIARKEEERRKSKPNPGSS